MTTGASQRETDEANRRFWDEICGSAFARMIGITDHSPESLERFDRAYMEMYPYLQRYLDWLGMGRILEIGVGYGTVAQQLLARGAEYTGVDIADGPVWMLKHRMAIAGLTGRAVTGSALALPFEPGSFDAVVSIGCVHHTGDMPRAIDEIHRVLVPGGRAMVMCYNRFSLREWRLRPVELIRHWLRGAGGVNEELTVRGSYDTNAAGDAAPHTELTSGSRVRRLFAKFADVRMHRENMDQLVWHGLILASRARVLSTLGRWVGRDWYVCAVKRRTHES